MHEPLLSVNDLYKFGTSRVNIADILGAVVRYDNFSYKLVRWGNVHLSKGVSLLEHKIISSNTIFVIVGLSKIFFT
jgi:hypothetical protein